MRNGPVTQQDRWEEDAGYSPFTLAVEIAALLAAADLADLAGGALHRSATCAKPPTPGTTASSAGSMSPDTDLARQLGVDGYYVRIAPPEVSDAAHRQAASCRSRTGHRGQSTAPRHTIVSPDALALVRFGLRAADDPRIVNTVKVIDALLKVETPSGPAGTATTTTATASTPTAALSTAPASAGPGRC